MDVQQRLRREIIWLLWGILALSLIIWQTVALVQKAAVWLDAVARELSRSAFPVG